MFSTSKSSWIILCLFCLVIFFSCSGGREEKADQPTKPENLSIVFGEGGGITGQWQGYTIGLDGEILKWSGRAAEQNSVSAGKLDEAILADLWSEIQNKKILENSGTAPGNMTRFLKIKTNGETYSISWAVDAANSTMSADLDQFYSKCCEIVEKKK
ncbi:MAG: hypothetical protein DWQ05_20335 [Calditrichaeota bacterium]|nr:MAG: hypothetical protein DWQ05_20335 [Calditrichota bacterium]